MAKHRVVALREGARLHIVDTERVDGDYRIDADEEPLRRRRSAINPSPWNWLTQVHGSAVVIVDTDHPAAGEEADAMVTAVGEVPLSIQTADCAPVVIYGTSNAFGIVHAGWRGLREGIVHETASVLRSLGCRPEGAYVGPCIGPECYRFGRDELDGIAEEFGDSVVAYDRHDEPALDIRAALAVALGREGVNEIECDAACTACGGRHFSHRARSDRGRHATVAWIETGSE